MSERIIRGQAWINKEKVNSGGISGYKYSLVQETITFAIGKTETNDVEVLIDDIWKDLTCTSGSPQQYKTNTKKDYFYWEYQMSDTSDETEYVTVKFECPKPVEGVFVEPYDPDSVTGDYAKFWVNKLKTATENYEKAAVIQKKEIVFKGTSYIDQNGDVVTINDKVVKNNDLGDITNLLNLF